MKFIIFLSLLFTSTLALAETIKEVGKIEYDKKSNLYFFYFMKDNQVNSIIIHPNSKEEVQLLKSQIDKAVILEGEVKQVTSSGEKISYREELDTPHIKTLSLELLKIDTKKLITQYNLLSHEKQKTKIKIKNSGTVQISNRAANGIISVAGTLVGIAAGPISLLPVSAYLINEGMNK